MKYCEFLNKFLARNYLHKNGYTQFEEYSESGDFGPGSREYWSVPGCERNEFGVALKCADLSQISARGWWVKDFAYKAEQDNSALAETAVQA